MVVSNAPERAANADFIQSLEGQKYGIMEQKMLH